MLTTKWRFYTIQLKTRFREEKTMSYIVVLDFSLKSRIVEINNQIQQPVIWPRWAKIVDMLSVGHSRNTPFPPTLKAHSNLLSFIITAFQINVSPLGIFVHPFHTKRMKNIWVRPVLSFWRFLFMHLATLLKRINYPLSWLYHKRGRYKRDEPVFLDFSLLEIFDRSTQSFGSVKRAFFYVEKLYIFYNISVEELTTLKSKRTCELHVQSTSRSLIVIFRYKKICLLILFFLVFF